MNTFGRIIGAGLLLALAAPAFCDVPDGLLGQWQDTKPLPANAHGSPVIQEFQADGTEHALTRSDGQLVPVREKDGSEIVVKYTIKGDKMTLTSLDGKHSQELAFKLEGNTLSFLPSGKYHNTANFERIPTPAPAAPDPSPAPAAPG